MERVIDLKLNFTPSSNSHTMFCEFGSITANKPLWFWICHTDNPLLCAMAMLFYPRDAMLARVICQNWHKWCENFCTKGQLRKLLTQYNRWKRFENVAFKDVIMVWLKYYRS